MSDRPWLETDDELLLDGVDYRVAGRLMGRTDRLAFQWLTLQPQLGGEQRELLQTDDAMMEAEALSPDLLDGRKVEINTRCFLLRWEGAVRTERSLPGAQPRFGSGRCAWYETEEDGAVAILIVDRHERSAILGVPMAPARIDLRFTKGLRRGGRD